jgi:hypothetical protein
MDDIASIVADQENAAQVSQETAPEIEEITAADNENQEIATADNERQENDTSLTEQQENTDNELTQEIIVSSEDTNLQFIGQTFEVQNIALAAENTLPKTVSEEIQHEQNATELPSHTDALIAAKIVASEEEGRFEPDTLAVHQDVHLVLDEIQIVADLNTQGHVQIHAAQPIVTSEQPAFVDPSCITV